MKGKKIRVATYLRTASKEQGQIFNLNLELNDLIDEHKDEWEIVDRVFDYGISGRKFNRPGLQHLLELCENKEIDMVVTLKSFMLARDVLIYQRIYKIMKDSETKLYIRAVKKGRELVKDSKECLPSGLFTDIAKAVHH